MHVKSCNKHVIALACNETFQIVIAYKSCMLCNAHYTGITCITSHYMHPTATSGQIVGFIRTVYAVPRRVLAAKGCITDPDQPCHSTFGPQPSSRGCQLVGPILRCFEPASRVHTTESVAPWIPWAPLWLILQVLMRQ